MSVCVPTPEQREAVHVGLRLALRRHFAGEDS